MRARRRNNGDWERRNTPGSSGLKTPTLPPNWGNLLAAWEEASADLAKKAEANHGGRYAVVWASCDVAKAARGLVKKLSKLAVEADLYPETKAALPWLVDSARWEIEALRCAATAAGVLRGQEQIGMAPMQLETVTVTLDKPVDNTSRATSEPEASYPLRPSRLIPHNGEFTDDGRSRITRSG